MRASLDLRSGERAPASFAPSSVRTVEGRQVVTLAWLGVLAILGGVAWLGVVGVQALVSAGGLSQAIDTARGRSVGPALVAVVVLLLLAEQRWPAVPRPLFARAHLVDAAYLVSFGLVVIPMLTIVETGFAIEIERHAQFMLLDRLALGPRVAVIVGVLLAIDGMNWRCHVANHRFEALWRLHALHHSQEDMSVLTTFRTHPLVHATYLPALLPVLVLGANGGVPAAAIITYGCLVTLPHANLRWDFGRLGHVLVSPAYHRLHHAASPLDARGAVNFGFVLVCWDRLAGRALFPEPGESPVPTGIAGRPVPVEQGVPGRKTVRVVLAQLAQPFRLGSMSDPRA
jgi:sterol desaturase/sphingolipid hydroxylase (fatty acid hydroxylase superfamily)